MQWCFPAQGEDLILALIECSGLSHSYSSQARRREQLRMQRLDEEQAKDEADQAFQVSFILSLSPSVSTRLYWAQSTFSEAEECSPYRLA